MLRTTPIAACVAWLVGSSACAQAPDGPPLSDNALSPNGSSPDGGSADAGPAPSARCGAKPFVRIKLMEDLSTSDDETDARFTADELTVILSVGGLDGIDGAPVILTRSSITEPFGKRTPAGLVAGSARPALNNDGKIAIFQAQVFANNATSWDLFRTERKDAKSSFGNGQALKSLNSGGLEADAFIVATGSSLYFTKSKSAAGYDIQHASAKDKKLADFSLEGDGALNAVNTADSETKPTPSHDELLLYYGKTTKARAVSDIWLATRTSASDPFAAGAPVPELNTDKAEAPTWLSADACRLYFVSNRPGGKGGSDIYVAERDL